MSAKLPPLGAIGPRCSDESQRGSVEKSRTFRDDSGWVDRGVAAVIVELDLLEIDRLGDSGELVDGTDEGGEVGALFDSVQVALEMDVVDGIEAHEGGEEADVAEGERVTHEPATG